MATYRPIQKVKSMSFKNQRHQIQSTPGLHEQSTARSYVDPEESNYDVKQHVDGNSV